MFATFPEQICAATDRVAAEAGIDLFGSLLDSDNFWELVNSAAATAAPACTPHPPAHACPLPKPDSRTAAPLSTRPLPRLVHEDPTFDFPDPVLPAVRKRPALPYLPRPPGARTPRHTLLYHPVKPPPKAPAKRSLSEVLAYSAPLAPPPGAPTELCFPRPLPAYQRAKEETYLFNLYSQKTQCGPHSTSRPAAKPHAAAPATLTSHPKPTGAPQPSATYRKWKKRLLTRP